MFFQLSAKDFSHLAAVPAESDVLATNAPLLKAGKLRTVKVD